MATLRDIKRRIKAVKNTSQITKAMKMVAAAKLRKAQGRMLELRPYSDKIYEVLGNLGMAASADAHPLLMKRPRKAVQLLVLTSDRGLCGAFNSNVLKAAVHFTRELNDEGVQVSISAVGRKARDYYKRRDIPLANSLTGISGKADFKHAKQIAMDIISGYSGSMFDEVYIVYNEFKSVIAQQVKIVKLLPFEHEQKEKEKEAAEAPESHVSYIFEPSVEGLYLTLIPKAVEIRIFRALLESQTSEEASRMTAMGNASQNAGEMIQRLTLVANKVRQATITRELMDIVGGVEAIKK
ncbi:MAG: ATP synthase F1 subunit gamma [Nitrospiraceae bacterium]|nr:ATP synthase F1 subunit gamma [Nitrospiraceae bacterium]